MKLYKNVDLIDLQSILSRGILSIDECGNDNWNEGNRADNETNVVYLFNSIVGQSNSFPRYGAALVEVDVDAQAHEIAESDWNHGQYEEYIIDRVDPEQIKAIYIPEIFKAKADEYVTDDMPIVWCGMSATHWVGSLPDLEKINCEAADLERFASTANVVSSTGFNYFRGEELNGEVMDLYDIRYEF